MAWELFDHRMDDEQGLLEKENVADQPGFEKTVKQLSAKLSKVFLK